MDWAKRSGISIRRQRERLDAVVSNQPTAVLLACKTHGETLRVAVEHKYLSTSDVKACADAYKQGHAAHPRTASRRHRMTINLLINQRQLQQAVLRSELLHGGD